MNRVILMGRLARDPEINTTQSGNTIARMTIAVDRMSKDKGADFIGLVAWNQTAQFAAKYLSKGRRVLVEGKIQTGSYQGQDGAKHYTVNVIVDHLEFADSKPLEGGEQKEAVQAEVPF